jgi:ABC-type hemin transport system ATPase subunit
VSEQSAEAHVVTVDQRAAGQGSESQPLRVASQESAIWSQCVAARGSGVAGCASQPFLSIQGGVLWPGAGRIDWQLHDDEQWAIVGPNGWGKTALLRALAGRRPLAGGRIAYHFAPEGGGVEQVALVKRPTLLILDEPCQGLDAGHRERILALLDGQPAGGETALIYVTHDPLALPHSITHLLRLEAGQVAARECLCQVGGERETS